MFTLSCISSNDQHTRFSIYDSEKTNCGIITVRTRDVEVLIKYNWNGNLEWNNIFPNSKTAERR